MVMKRIVCAFAIFAAAAAASGPAFAADPAAGEKVFAKCKACHQLAAGKHGVGPSLQGFLGRKAGTVEKFNFSPDMKAAGEKGLVWSDEAFLAYIEKPQEYVGQIIGKPKASTRMVFVGLPKKEERDDLLAYLKGAAK
jgi:cytochrome c